MLSVIAKGDVTGRTDLIHKVSSAYGKCQSKGPVYELLDLLIKNDHAFEDKDKAILLTDQGIDLLKAVDYCIRRLEG